MPHSKLKSRNLTEESITEILQSVDPSYLPPKKREPTLAGYQKRTDILTTGYGDVSLNRIPSPKPYVSKQDMVRDHYNRLGAIVPPVPTRVRVPDSLVITGTPQASRVMNVSGITSKHNVFYDVRTGEIVLVVLGNSRADRFYTRYYEGKTTFPHISKMNGAEISKRLSAPPLLLIINDEPVFWGYGPELIAKAKNDPEFAEILKTSKRKWLQVSAPFMREPVTRPIFDLPRLRFVHALESGFKRTK